MIVDLEHFPSANPNPVLRVKNGIVAYTNKAGKNLFGIQQGNKVPELLRELISSPILTNVCETREIEISDEYFSFSIVPLEDTDYVNIYGNNITERKKAEEKIRDLARFPAENPNPVLRVKKNTILYSNSAGKSLFEIQEGDNIPQILREYINGPRNEVELEIDDKFYSFIITPVEDQDYANIYGRDITEKKESEKKFKALFDYANDGIFIHLSGGEFLEVNKTACERLGYTREEFLKLSPKEINPPDMAQRIPGLIKELYEKGQFIINSEHITKSGKAIPVEINSRTFEYKGKPAIISTVRDISERLETQQRLKESKESEEKYRKLVESFPFSIFLIDPYLKICESNRAAELLLNKSGEEIIGKYIFDIFKVNLEKLDLISLSSHNAIDFDVNNEISFELNLSKSNNEKIWVEAFFSPVVIGHKKFAQIIIQDITQIKKAEDIVKEENERLKRINKIKKKLTAETSKQLKSPLMALFNASQVLLTTYKDQLDENALDLLEQINRGGGQSIDLVEKMLDITRIESKSLILNKKTQSLVEIIKKVLIKLEEKFARKNHHRINLNINSEELYSEIDENRIIQVITDLTLSMLKKSTRRTTINISLHKINGQAEISIIKQNYVKKEREIKEKILFDKQLEVFSFEFNLSKEIIELHGGQLITENNATFIIKLPIKNWRELLNHIYIIFKSGLPLYDYAFVKKDSNFDSFLISGGIIGIITIMKEMFQGKKQIRTIDHGDLKVMFETNQQHKDVIFVLLVKEELDLFRKKLDLIIEDFEENYRDLLENMPNSSSVGVYDWHSLKYLIEKQFE